ncbi:polysaccharide pyruvyl transferase family protein [Arthrobacter sp. UYCo732]|uniref:polysaccharide pyruvyl transferase family protein n=1 Tax=Arthrobacter sp. UYCo732 TaxID=3156336 RepID=UPI0033958725
MSNTWTSELPRVLLLHAYSPRNSGDGLLVTLAREAIEQALGPSDIKVVASDAEAFHGQEFYQWQAHLPDCLSRRSRRISMLATALLGPTKEIRHLVREADLVVAVGGGYLRGGSLGPAIKSWGAHFGQLRLAASEGHKSVYLPQSIGPFKGIYKRAIERNLAQLHTVYARDDRTIAEFKSVASMERMPDMAVLELARDPKQDKKAANLAERPIFVARELTEPRSYYDLLEAAAVSGNFEWALQSTGGGNDDFPLTLRLNGRFPRTMKEALDESQPRIVVSTRLHGALSSLIAGFPAIHLSYERKGWGAFEDLGLGDYVLNARDATLPEIDELIERIRENPEKYWAAIDENRRNILRRTNSLRETIKSIALTNLRLTE